jgi:hypothetical protein
MHAVRQHCLFAAGEKFLPVVVAQIELITQSDNRFPDVLL